MWTANRFVRVSDWHGTWREAYDLAGKFATLFPDLQVYYVCSSAYEQWERDSVAAGTMAPDDNRLEDHANVLTDAGKRIRMIDRPMPDDIRHALFPANEHNAILAIEDNVLTFVAVYPEVPAQKIDGYTRRGTPFVIVRALFQTHVDAVHTANVMVREFDSWMPRFAVTTYGDWTTSRRVPVQA